MQLYKYNMYIVVKLYQSTFLTLIQNNQHSQLKEEEVLSGSQFQEIQHLVTAPRQEDHGGRAWWSKAA